VVDNKLEKELQKLLEVEAVQVEEVDMLGIHMQKVPECIIHFLYIMTTLKKIIHIDEELKYLILIEMMYSKDTRQAS
jgi:hypothetical protein